MIIYYFLRSIANCIEGTGFLSCTIKIWWLSMWWGLIISKILNDIIYQLRTLLFKCFGMIIKNQRLIILYKHRSRIFKKLLTKFSICRSNTFTNGFCSLLIYWVQIFAMKNGLIYFQMELSALIDIMRKWPATDTTNT